MTPADTLRLALAGTRTDRLRVVITASGGGFAVLALLCAATVQAVQPDSGRYTNRIFEHEALLLNVVFASVLFTVPVMFFVAQCARLAAPGRNRRLAAFRLAGATPGQIRLIAAVETGVAAGLGSVLGCAAYLAARVLLDAPGSDGKRPLPTDVLPSAPAFTVVLTSVPLLATGLTIVLLQRAAFSPSGVIRRIESTRVRVWPGLLGVVGLLDVSGLEAASRSAFVRSGRLGTAQEPLFMLAALVAAVLVTLGLTLGTAWVGYVTARLLLRLTKRPSALIAARQTLADPYDGTRTYAVIQVVTAFGAAAAMVRSYLMVDVLARNETYRQYAASHGGRATDISGTAPFREEVFTLVGVATTVLMGVAALTLLVALVESGVARRRTLAALVAAGTPRAVLARALCWRVLTPMLPGIVAASLIGMLAMRPFTRTASGRRADTACAGTPEQCLDETYWRQHEVVDKITVTLPVPIPWAQIATVAGTALLAVVVVLAASVALQRSTTNPAELRAE